MTDTDVDYDPQDQAEVLDETNLTPDGTDRVTFEEIDDDHVKDLTQLIGDADEDDEIALDAADFEDESVGDDALEGDEDSPDEVSDLVATADDDSLDDVEDLDTVDGVAELEDDEVELEYAGDLDEIEGAESGAQDLESEGELSNADLTELGYKE